MAMPGKKKITYGPAQSFKVDPNLLIEINKLTDWKKIGEGGCGEVFSVMHEDWGPLAVKKLGVTMMDEGLPVTSKLKEEAKILYTLRHKNIVPFSGVLWCPPDFGLAMPLMPHGSLKSFLASYETGWLVKVDFMKQINLGINYLHCLPQPVTHGDLKLSNVLVDDGCVLKLSDFGLSTWRSYQSTHSKVKTHVSGTITHIAPECWEDPNLRPGVQQDVYGFAILCWELFSEKEPFEGSIDQRIIHSVIHGGRPRIEDMGSDIPQDIKDITTTCWSQKPAQRPDMSYIKTTMDELTMPISKDLKKAKAKLLSVIEDSDESDEENLFSSRDNSEINDVNMEQVSCIEIDTGFCMIGFGPNGEFCATFSGNPNMRFYAMNSIKKYALIWEHLIPEDSGLTYLSRKYITSKYIIMRECTDESVETFVFDKMFVLKKRLGPVAMEMLIGANDSELIYERKEGNWKTILKRSLESHTISTRFDKQLRIETANDMFFVGESKAAEIVVSAGRTNEDYWLTLSSAAGKELLTKHVDFRPGRPCISKERIIVPVFRGKEIHLFDWSGNESGVVPEDQLQLSSHRFIKGSDVFCDDLLSFLVQDENENNLVVTYKISM